MSDDTKRANRQNDPAHQTMPPELRPFARPEPPQRLVAPEDEAEFKAVITVLSVLNGGPAADPFYVDAKGDSDRGAEAVAPEKPQAAPSVKVYAPPIGVRGGRSGPPRRFDCEQIDTRELKAYCEKRAAEEAAAAAGAKSAAEALETSSEGDDETTPAPSSARGLKVVRVEDRKTEYVDTRPFRGMHAANVAAAVAREANAAKHKHEAGAIDIRPYQDMAAVRAAVKVEEDETTLERAQTPGSGPANSPWAKEAEVAPIAVADLPSSLSPGAKSVRVEPAAESEKPAGVPVDGGNKGARVMGVMAVVAVIGFAAFQLMPKAPVVEAPVPVPVRSAGAAVGVRPQPEVSSGDVVVPSASAVVPAATTEVDAGVSGAPSAAVVPMKPRARIEDPYDAAAPGPAKTVEAVVIPPPIAPVISAAPSISPAPTVAPSAKPNPVGGNKRTF